MTTIKINRSSYVWYFSYGSNICRERFYCYLRGGLPTHSTKMHRGCSDNALPLKEQPFRVRQELIFGREKSHWGKGGVAFIQPGITSKETWGRMYLIKLSQFLEVLQQEAGSKKPVHLCLDELKNCKNKTLLPDSWYGKVVLLDNCQGYPVLTITHDKKSINLNAPHPNYLNTIFSGLKEAFNESDQLIMNYLSEKPGIAGNYSVHELNQILITSTKDANPTKKVV